MIDINEENLLRQFRESKDLEIERLLDQYSTSLEDMREMYPQLTETISQRQALTTFPTEPMFFTPSEAAQMGLSLQEGWMLKISPTEDGLTSSFITPSKWEITEDDLYISPEGVEYNRADLEALLSPPSGGLEAAPVALTVEDLTEQGQGQYRLYQEAGGELGVAGWIDLRENQQLETEQIFGRVFPEQDIQEVVSYIETNPEDFLTDIREIGRSEDTEALIKFLMPEITEDELYDIFGQPTPQESKIKDVFDALFLRFSHLWYGTKQYILSELPQKILGDLIGASKGEISLIPLGPQFTPKWLEGKEIPETGLEIWGEGIIKKLQEGYANREAQYNEWIIAHPELQPREEWSKGAIQTIKENPSILLDPAYIAYIASDAAAFTLSFLGASIGVTAITKNPYLGLMAGVAITTPAQSHDVYEDLLAHGATPEQASNLAVPIGALISSIEVVGGMPVLKAIAPAFFKTLTQNAQKEIIRLTMGQVIKKGLVTIGKIEVAETLEEIVQQAIQNATVKTIDENRSLLEGIDETTIRTLIATLPLAIFGGGTHTTYLYNQMSAEQKTQIAETIQKLTDNGVPKEQAELVAIGDILETPEGQDALKRAMEDVQATWEEASKQLLEGELANKLLNELKIAEEIKVTPVTPEVIAKQTWEMTAHDFEANITYLEWLQKQNPTQLTQAQYIERYVYNKSESMNYITAETIAKGEHKAAIRESLSRGTPVAPQILEDYPDLKPTAEVPITPLGMPEAGYQPGMMGVLGKEVTPQATGKLVQARIDDYLRLRDYNAKAVENRIAEIKKQLETKGRLPKGQGTKGDLRLELARLDAQQELDAVENIADLDGLIREVEKELGRRSLPGQGEWARSGIALARHPRKPNIFPEYTSRQLEEMRNVYLQAREKLQPSTPIVKAQDVPMDMPALQTMTLTSVQVEKTIDLFKQAVIAPNAELQRAAAIELRKHVLAQRAKSASESAEAMIVEGMNPEEAIKAAEQMFMTGKLPDMTTDYFDDLTQEMRNVLFAKAYNYWHNKPGGWLELISTFDALTNALAGKSIPRVKGIGSKYFPNGGSAWDRLARVFVGDIEVLNALDQGKSLRDVIQGVLLESGRGEIALSQETVDWLKELSTISEEDKLLLTKPLSELTEEDVRRIATRWFWQRQNELNTLLASGTITRSEYQLELAIAKDKVFPHEPIKGIPSAEWAAYNEAFKELPLLTLREKETIVRTLKSLGMGVVDIGNFIRANKASVDMSYWRQIMTMAVANPIEFYRSNVEAWKSLFSQASAEANWEWVKRQPSFPYYDEMVRQTGQDFLRMLAVPKGTAQWQAAEEFGYLTEERTIPRFTARVPWIKVSGRAFVSGINSFTILVYNKCLKAALNYADEIATGKVKLPEGEGFSIQQEMNDYGKAIAWMTQRASLGKLRAAAPEIGSLFFAPRSKLGRWFTPRLLIDSNPRVRAFAWKNLSSFVGTTAAFVMLGYFLGLWDVERDPRNAEFMSIRIGNLRIDPWAGYRQFLVLYTRLITGTGISSVTGQEYEVNPIGALTNFFRSSLAPLSGTLLDFWTGKDFLGDKVDIANPKQWVDRIAPFAIQSILEAWQDDWQHGLIAIIPSIFGEGVSTYTGDWAQNWARIGLPKYPENTGYGIYEPIYDVKDFWADTASQFKGVDPATLTASKGFPEYVRSIATALQVIDQLETLPNKKLILLNADPEKGTTFIQYYQMWQDRQKIVASGDKEALKAFDADERTRNAYLGNITQSQYALLVEYHSLPETEKADFLGRHPELYINPREEWLRTHPEENALLALWDVEIKNAKVGIYSLDAQGKVSTLANSLGIPENALVMKDLDAVTELKLKNQSLFDLLEAYGGLDDTLKGPDGLTARDRAIQQLYLDNPDFRDDERRIDALNVGTKENPTLDAMIEGWVERGQIADEFGASSVEMKLWLIDNKEVHQWALENALLSDTGEDWNENILRLQVNYSEDFEKYENYGDKKSPLYISNDNLREEAREAMKFDNKGMTSFGVAYYTINALQKDIPENLVSSYVEYYGVRKKEGVDYLAGWYEDDWYKIEHLDFYNTMVSMGLWQKDDFTKVPTRQVYSLYKTYMTLPTGQPRLDFRAENKTLDDWLVFAKGYTPIGNR